MFLLCIMVVVGVTMINETPFLCLTTHRALRDTAGESVGEAVSGRESCFTKTGQEPKNFQKVATC
jgi:hypothetical protein